MAISLRANGRALGVFVYRCGHIDLYFLGVFDHQLYEGEQFVAMPHPCAGCQHDTFTGVQFRFNHPVRWDP